MNNNSLLILVVGISVAVVVYLLFKFWQSRRNRLTPPPPQAPVQRAAVSPPQVPGVAPPILPPQSVPQPQRPVPQRPAAVPGQPIVDEFEDYPYADQGDYAFGPATPVMAAMVPGSPEAREKETRYLRNAGFYSPHAWHNFSAYRFLGIILPILACGLLLVLTPEALEPWLMAGLIVLPIVGWSVPGLFVQSRAQERVREIGNAMPDMLDLLNMCVSQGMTVPTALRRISHDIQPVYPDLAKELKIVTDQSRVGSLEQALMSFSKRVDVPEVHSFTSLLTQTEKMGTSVSQALNDYSDNIREAMRQRADQKANSAAFWLLFPTVFCLMTSVFLFLMGPAIIQLTDFANDRSGVLDTTQALEAINTER